MIIIDGQELPAHVSYSQLTTWLDCGWKYYMSKVERVPEEGSWWLVGGTSVHKATEVIDRAMFQVEGK
jgi:hypothetical protein